VGVHDDLLQINYELHATEAPAEAFDVTSCSSLAYLIGAVLLQSLVACKFCLIRPGVSLGVRLGVSPLSPRLSGNASARRVLLSPAPPTPRLQRPLIQAKPLE
jgi:hypothetical protein